MKKRQTQLLGKTIRKKTETGKNVCEEISMLELAFSSEFNGE